METRYKRGKSIATESTRGGNTRGRDSREEGREGREGREDRDREGRGGITIAVKSKTIDHPIELSSDSEKKEKSDDGFEFLESSDEKFDRETHLR